MRQLGVGVIGLGVGEHHLAGYLRHPACAVTMLCDFAEDTLAMAAAKYPGIRVTKDAAEVVESPDIDVVSVASYDHFHFGQIAGAIRHGKHVFAEKPVCLSGTELREIRRLLTAHPGVQFSSNLILRRCPRFLRLKELITGGALGELYYVEGDYLYGRLHKITEGWRGQLEFYSVVLGGAIHLIDLLLWLTGGRVEEVQALGNRIASRNSRFRHNDFVGALLRFGGGLIGKVTANFGCVHPHFHAVAVYGTTGTFLNGPEAATLLTREGDTPVERRMTDPYPGYQKGDLIHSFIEAILHGTPAAVTAEDVFEAMSVGLAIEQATGTGETVTVEYV